MSEVSLQKGDLFRFSISYILEQYIHLMIQHSHVKLRIFCCLDHRYPRINNAQIDENEGDDMWLFLGYFMVYRVAHLVAEHCLLTSN